MNGDYVQLAGSESEAEIVRTLVDLLNPVSTSTNESTYTTLSFSDDVFAIVDFYPGDSWTAVLALGHATDDDQVRRSTAKRVYERLASDTAWRLRWTSDASADVLEVGGRRQTMVIRHPFASGHAR